MVMSAGAMTLGVADASNDEVRAMTRSASLYNNGNLKILRVTLRTSAYWVSHAARILCGSTTWPKVQPSPQSMWSQLGFTIMHPRQVWLGYYTCHVALQHRTTQKNEVTITPPLMRWINTSLLWGKIVQWVVLQVDCADREIDLMSSRTRRSIAGEGLGIKLWRIRQNTSVKENLLRKRTSG